MGRMLVLGVLIAAVMTNPVRTWGQEPRASRATARESFQDARLGLFVHWGLHAILGRGEWVMERDRLPVAEYEKLPPHFQPTKFDAERWARLARTTGAKYLVVTAKSYDGFCLFDSKLTRFDIVDATPFGKDPLKDLAEACRQSRIKLFFNYSLLDWHHPDYVPRGKTGRGSGRPETGDWKQYVAYYQGQIRELCTNYGELGGIRLDGMWDRPQADWEIEATYRLIHELQPGALVANNHHAKPFADEDFQILGQDVADLPRAEPVPGLPVEQCLTINESWGYNAGDTQFKSPEQLIHALLNAAGRGANLLLNVGAKPDGSLEAEVEQRLEAVGEWLERQGDTVYATRAGPVAPQVWGVSVQKKNEVLLHVLRPDVPIRLPGVAPPVKAQIFRSGKPVKVEPTPAGLELRLPEEDRMPMDTIIDIKKRE